MSKGDCFFCSNTFGDLVLGHQFNLWFFCSTQKGRGRLRKME